MSNTISNMDDVIDSRDIIARIEQLSALRQPGPVDLGDEEDNATDQDSLFAELTSLEALAADGENYSGDWSYGATLIRDSYFQTYAEELADDLGLVNHEISWPYTCIDWERAASDLRMDYTSVDFDGVTYWVR